MRQFRTQASLRRTHKRGRRSPQITAHKANRRQQRTFHRREYRRVKQCLKALAKSPVTLSKAQERILAETHDTNNESFDNRTATEEQNDNTTHNDETPNPHKTLQTRNRNLRVATLNARGMNYITARQQAIYFMKKHNIDILAILKTHVNCTGNAHLHTTPNWILKSASKPLTTKIHT